MPRNVLRGRKYRKFIAYAAEFQLYVGADNPILLPLRCTAATLNLDDETVSIFRRAAKKDGLLQEVAPYQARRSATKFKFNLTGLNQVLKFKRPLGLTGTAVENMLDNNLCDPHVSSAATDSGSFDIF